MKVRLYAPKNRDPVLEAAFCHMMSCELCCARMAIDGKPHHDCLEGKEHQRKVTMRMIELRKGITPNQ